ncbi:MAG TPA: hypothetical protein VN372_08605 [Methanospirillum sp.]|nr:hypothetical protein [Methanospirillum sp.]
MNRSGILLLSCLMAVVLAGIVSGSDDLKVYYLNTSHGDATLLESSGHFMMINAGDQQDFADVKAYLTETGVTTLDYAIATNLNESAIGGMSDLMKAFPVSRYSDSSSSFTSPSQEKIKAMIETDQIGYEQATPGLSLPFGMATIQILNTTTSAKVASENAMSLSVSEGGVSFLFTGNQNLGPTPATIWAVPNQGREGSIATLSAVSPQVLVISTGASGPDKKVLDDLKKLKIEPVLTNKDGNIVISTDGDNYTVISSNGKTFQKPTPVPTPTPKSKTGSGNSTVSPTPRVVNQT